ncbi:MAG: SEC-C domain-containing protein, partial [Lactobacillus sp.]|nr:SEC-C domain-containing protein [Lactobacillus sp.]
GSGKKYKHCCGQNEYLIRQVSYITYIGGEQ